MKTFRLFATMLMVAMCAMVVTSCSDDDDDDNGKGDLSAVIVGTWKITAWESDESGAEQAIGTQFTFKKDGFVDFGNVTNAAKWSILKKSTTYKDEMYGNTVLQYDALLLKYLTENDETVYLVKEYTSNTAQVSILEFELGGGYSRGTLTKIK